MQVETTTAVKVAWDVVHDADEFIRKWPWLMNDPDDAPEGSTVLNGYIDFEFADGGVTRIPCAWVVTSGKEAIPREKITLDNKAGTTAEISHTKKIIYGGEAKGAGFTKPLKSNEIKITGAIYGDAGLNLANVAIQVYSAYMCDISGGKISIPNILSGTVADSVFENLIKTSSGNINAVIDALNMDSMRISDIGISEEMRRYVHIFEAGGKYADGRVVGGAFLESGLSPNGTPQNGFGESLGKNPYFPDYIKLDPLTSAPYSIPQQVWVPSYAKPNGIYWQDDDNIYWSPVVATTAASMFGSPDFVYPPRCIMPNGRGETLPVRKIADGLVVTIEMPPRYCHFYLTDTYTYKTDTEWSWNPGYTQTVSSTSYVTEDIERHVKEFILKRSFKTGKRASGVNDIISVTYELLWLDGGLDG